MKRIITIIFLMGWVLTTYSQKVIQLEETKLNFTPTANIIFEDYANGIVKVRENYATQFHLNAIDFMIENFDIQRYIAETGNDPRDIIITATSSKGFLRAIYDDKGNLLNTFQKFVDIPLPYAVRNEVYAQYKGWTITRDKYIASGRESNIDTEKYIVYLEKGKDRAKLKITPASLTNTGVAMIEKF